MRISPSIRTGSLLAVTLAATYLSTALAGYTAAFPVQIDLTARTAQGQAGTVRNSADHNQYVYCKLSGTTTLVTGACFAVDNSTPSKNLRCSSTNANIVGAIRAMSPDSLVYFKSDTNNKCTEVQITNGSYLEPKKP